jgi:hypothetical protein
LGDIEDLFKSDEERVARLVLMLIHNEKDRNPELDLDLVANYCHTLRCDRERIDHADYRISGEEGDSLLEGREQECR